jgi:hypothetical protein
VTEGTGVVGTADCHLKQVAVPLARGTENRVFVTHKALLKREMNRGIIAWKKEKDNMGMTGQKSPHPDSGWGSEILFRFIHRAYLTNNSVFPVNGGTG